MEVMILFLNVSKVSWLFVVQISSTPSISVFFALHHNIQHSNHVGYRMFS